MLGGVQVETDLHISFLRENVPISGEAVNFTPARNVSIVEVYLAPPWVAAGLLSVEWEEVIFKITDGSSPGLGLQYCELSAG